LVRLAIACVQAAALYLLAKAAGSPHFWPATEPEVFDPLFLVALFVPLAPLQALGQIPARSLLIWIAVVTLMLVVLGYFDAARLRVEPFGNGDQIFPSWQLLWALMPSLFVAHVLVTDQVAERRLVPSYPRHFDTAWKIAVQLVLAAVFAIVFHLVLALGAGLFQLLNVGFFSNLIDRLWFLFPSITLSVAVALHLTDVQPALIRGARSLALTLFSWLLPALAVILLGFLVSLPFISLAPLWKTNFAATLLLIAAGSLVFFLNCAYQDGTAPQAINWVKRAAGTIAAVELIPLVGLAIWALGLRVGEYGWTEQRIFAAAIIALGACYAVGYGLTLVPAPAWMKRLEITNFIGAYVFLGLVLVLFTPIADPARLMVADQVARLKSGRIAPDKFDFASLKFDGARWGAAALAELSQTRLGPNADMISSRARLAMALISPYGVGANSPYQLTPEQMAGRVDIYPAGRNLPASFYQLSSSLWAGSTTPTCLILYSVPKCKARFIVLQPNAPEAIIFMSNDGGGSVFEQDATGSWHSTGYISNLCGAIRNDLADGAVGLAAHPEPDLVVDGRHLTIDPIVPCV